MRKPVRFEVSPGSDPLYSDSGQPYPEGVDPDESPLDSGALGCDGGVWPEDYPGDSGWGA